MLVERSGFGGGAVSAALKWEKREEWKTGVYVGRKQVAGIKVVRWSFRAEGEAKPSYSFGMGENNWNVYAYIYPEHPLFEKFSAHATGDNGDSYELTSSMPLHGGQTFFQLNYGSAGKVDSVQIGCDYMHSGDEHYNEFATKEDAYSVFRDAEELREWLLTRATTGDAA
jgi:hypothetical protein